MQEQLDEIKKMGREEAQNKLERLCKYSSSSEARTDLITACENRLKELNVDTALVVKADFS